MGIEIKGADGSHFQGEMNFPEMKADGIEFIMLKATEGDSWVDPTFVRNLEAAKAAGIHVGAYVYIDSGMDLLAQVEHFWSIVEPHINDLTYPLAIDLEENKSEIPKETLTADLIKGLEFLEGKHQFAMWYTDLAFLNEWLDAEKLKPYAGWVARYAAELGITADMWQYTQTGVVHGVNEHIDLDISYRDFAAEIHAMRTPVTPPEAPKPVLPTKPPTKVIDTYSLVDWLKAHHHPFDFVSRVAMAVKMGIHGYNGSASQNTELLDKLANAKAPVVDTYTVQSGDELEKIAISHHTTVDELVKLNHIENPNEIQIGQIIKLK